MQTRENPVVILCGGKGTRLREQTEEIPKPLVEIGGMPILWHIMKCYSHFGFNHFILCLGYKGEKIKNFFINLHDRVKNDFTLFNGQFYPHSSRKSKDKPLEDWKITFVETGPETNTGGRIKQAEKYVEHFPFFVTYGDGLADIQINRLLDYHQEHGKTATMTCVQPRSQFGIVKIGSNNLIASYQEKPKMEDWVNGGFFVFNKDIFSAINDNDVLEQEPIKRLEAKKELIAYRFKGYWACMDTYKDAQVLNDLWNCSKAPWKHWND